MKKRLPIHVSRKARPADGKAIDRTPSTSAEARLAAHILERADTMPAGAGGGQPAVERGVLALQASQGNRYVQDLSQHFRPAVVARRETSPGLDASSQTRSKAVEKGRQIAGLRKRLDEAKADLIDADAAEKPDLKHDIYGLEMLLADALEARVELLETSLAQLAQPSEFEGGGQGPASANPELEFDRNTAEAWLLKELERDRKELDSYRRIFDPKVAALFGEKYRTEIKPLPGGGCMTAMYKGLEVLFSEEESKSLKKEVVRDSAKILKQTGHDTNSVDRVLETMRKHGKAGSPVTANYNQKLKAWSPTVESLLFGMIDTDMQGWYFFGLSVSGAYHTVTLAVDNSEGSAHVYWMDQFSRGFTNDVTGSLDDYLKAWKPSYGYAVTKLWPIIPTPEAKVEVKAAP
jgi:hypothetical protein